MEPIPTRYGLIIEQHRANLRERWQMARTLFAVGQRSRKRWRLHLLTLRTVLRPSCQAAYYRRS